MIKPRDEKINTTKEMMTDSVNKRLIIVNKGGLLHYFYLQNGRINYFDVENMNASEVKAGNIYIGRVGHVNKEINGHFIYINDNTQVFLPGEHLDNTILCNRSYDGKLHESDEVIVQIKKEAYANKKAMATTNIKYNKDIKMEELLLASKTRRKYSLLYEGGSCVEQMLRCGFGLEDVQIICSDQEGYDYIYEHLQLKNVIYGGLSIYDDDKISITALYSLRNKFAEITNEKVWLKSGGYLYIQPTEAMIVIDVNSGKTSGKDRENTIMNINSEAIEEIAFQIKARNLSGIIIVDLINSKSPDFNTILTKAFESCFEGLKPRPMLVDITKLGLAEITRQKISSDIYERLRKMDKTILM